MKYLFDLETYKLRFHFRATTDIILPPYKGATFRGTFGQMFKSVVCNFEGGHCPDCPRAQRNPDHERVCPYFYLFETANDGRIPAFNSSPKAPQPFVIEPPEERARFYEAGDPFIMDLILIGNARKYITYFIHTFEEIGKRGGIGRHLRKGFGRFRLDKVGDMTHDVEEIIYYLDHQSNPQFIASPRPAEPVKPIDSNSDDPLTLEFITPTKIRSRQRYIEHSAEYPLTFKVLIEFLFRRAHLLYAFHQHQRIPAYDRPEVPLLDVLDHQLKWDYFDRYTNRQGCWVRDGGFKGQITFAPGWQFYYPLLKIGERIHVGKETTFGLGKYRILSPNIEG